MEYEKFSGYFRNRNLVAGSKSYDFITGAGLTDDDANTSFMTDISNWSIVASHWQTIYFCYIVMIIFSAMKVLVFGFLGTNFFRMRFKFFHESAIITAEVIKT